MLGNKYDSHYKYEATNQGAEEEGAWLPGLNEPVHPSVGHNDKISEAIVREVLSDQGVCRWCWKVN